MANTRNRQPAIYEVFLSDPVRRHADNASTSLLPASAMSMHRPRSMETREKKKRREGRRDGSKDRARSCETRRGNLRMIFERTAEPEEHVARVPMANKCSGHGRRSAMPSAAFHRGCTCIQVHRVGRGVGRHGAARLNGQRRVINRQWALRNGQQLRS